MSGRPLKTTKRQAKAILSAAIEVAREAGLAKVELELDAVVVRLFPDDIHKDEVPVDPKPKGYL